ncbi:MAG: phosphotransferase [Mycobacterium sp.]|nr:phosphotransferase [Mycobacterium sp.]
MTTVAMPMERADITADWLSSALTANIGSQVAISALKLEQVGTGQAGSTYRITPTYGTDDDSDLPPTLILKLPAEDPALRAGLALGYRSEVAFYGKVAGRVRAPIPRCYHSAINDEGTEFALILSDLDPSIQGDQISGCSEEHARLVAEALAGLHGPSWCDPDWLELAEVAMPKPGDVAAAQLMGEVAVTATDMVLARLGGELDPVDHDTLRSAMQMVAPWLAEQPRYSLMHGDFRADNLMFHPTHNAVAIVDWQTIGVGMPTRDLASFTASSLQPDVRRNTERDLVDCYHAALQQHGVTGYDREVCWHDYCIGMVQPPLISLLGCAFATPTPRGDAMFVHTLRRSALAIRDLQTLDLIED